MEKTGDLWWVCAKKVEEYGGSLYEMVNYMRIRNITLPQNSHWVGGGKAAPPQTV